jgi:hypothetical protein
MFGRTTTLDEIFNKFDLKMEFKLPPVSHMSAMLAPSSFLCFSFCLTVCGITPLPPNLTLNLLQSWAKMKSSALLSVLLAGSAVLAGSLLPPRVNKTDPESWKYSHLKPRQQLGYLTWAIGM